MAESGAYILSFAASGFLMSNGWLKSRSLTLRREVWGARKRELPQLRRSRIPFQAVGASAGWRRRRGLNISSAGG